MGTKRGEAPKQLGILHHNEQFSSCNYFKIILSLLFILISLAELGILANVLGKIRLEIGKIGG